MVSSPPSDLELDEDSKKMLKLMFDNEGEANTSEFKKELGLGNDKIHYRYDKLTDLGLIRVEQGEPSGGRLPPKEAELTERCEAAIQQGLIGDVFESNVPDSVEVSKENFEEYQESLDRLEVRLNSLKDALDTLDAGDVEAGGGSGGELEGDMSVVKARFDEVNEELEEVRSQAELAEQRVEELRNDLEKFRERFNEKFLPFLRATRSALKEELDINVMDYYDPDDE